MASAHHLTSKIFKAGPCRVCDGPGGDSLYYAIRCLFTSEDHARPTHPASKGLDDAIH